MKKSVIFKNKENKRCGGIAVVKNSTENASIFLYGDIVDEEWEKWVLNESKCPKDVINLIGELDENEPVDIYINSGGGSVFAGTSMYNILKRHNGKKTVYVDGIAASIASVIAMAGDEIKMGVGSTMMIHKPWALTSGNANDLREMADLLDTLQVNIMDIYESKLRNKEDRAKVEELVNNSTYLTAEETAELFNVTVEKNNESIMNKIFDFAETEQGELDTATDTATKTVDTSAAEIEMLKMELI